MTPRRAHAKIGEEVGLFLDTDLMVTRGDYVTTGTGRTYQVRSATVQKTDRRAGQRWNLRVEVLGYPPIEETVARARAAARAVHHLRWYRRTRGG